MTIEEFCAKLKEFCLAHGFAIVGGCTSEGILGEIVVCRTGELELGDYVETFNFAYIDGRPIELTR